VGNDTLERVLLIHKRELVAEVYNGVVSDSRRIDLDMTE